MTGQATMEAVTLLWNEIPVMGTELAPKGQTCCYAGCVEKASAVKFFRCGGREQNVDDFWYFCQLECMIAHLFHTKSSQFEAFVDSKKTKVPVNERVRALLEASKLASASQQL